MMTNQTQTSPNNGCLTSEDTHVELISPIKGYWFYFENGDDEIAIFASGWSGKEVVYFNDNPVSESRNFRFTSVHKFTKNSVRYKIVYKVVSMLTGEVHCELHINNNLIDEQTKAVVARGSAKKAWLTILGYFGVGMIFGYLGAKIALYFAGS